MGFNNRRIIPIYYNIDTGEIQDSLLASGGTKSPPEIYIGEEVSFQIYLITFNVNTNTFDSFNIKDSTSNVFTLTANATSGLLDPSATNPIVGYSYGADGDFISQDYQGIITAAIDFPDYTELSGTSGYNVIGYSYLMNPAVGDSVTDVITGQTFYTDEIIAWNGSYWSSVDSSGVSVPQKLQGINVDYDWIGPRQTVTVDSSDSTVINAPAHGLAVGDAVLAKNKAGIFPTTPNFLEDTKYWVISVIDVDNFKVGTAPTDSEAIDLVDNNDEFYLWQSYANAYKGQFSARFKTSESVLKDGWTSPSTISLILSSIAPNDETYVGAPPNYLTNIFNIPLIIKELPWIEAAESGIVLPPDYFTDYPTTASVLAMLAAKINRADPTSDGFIPVFTSTGQLAASSYSPSDLVTTLDQLEQAYGDTTVDCNGYNITFNDVSGFSLQGQTFELDLSGSLSIDAEYIGLTADIISIHGKTVEISGSTITVNADTLDLNINSGILLNDGCNLNGDTVNINVDKLNLDVSSGLNITGDTLNVDMDNIYFKNFGFDSAAAIQLSGGNLPITQAHLALSGSSSNLGDLNNVNNANDGELVVIYPKTGYYVTLKHGVGNIITPDESDIVLDDSRMALLIKSENYWRVLYVQGASADIGLSSGEVSGIASGVAAGQIANLDLADNTVHYEYSGSASLEDLTNNTAWVYMQNAMKLYLPDISSGMTKELYLMALDSGSKYYDPGTHNINGQNTVLSTHGIPYVTLHLKARKGHWVSPDQLIP